MIREGSAVRISTSIARKIGRPGVVVRLFVIDGRRLALVAWGTGTLRTHLRHVAVVPREPAGIVLGLTKPTYFYGHRDTRHLYRGLWRTDKPGRSDAGSTRFHTTET